MPSLLIQFIFLLLLILLHNNATLVVHSLTHPEDVRALRDLARGIDLHSILNGSCLASWDLSFSIDPCDHLFSDRFTCGLRCDLLDPSTNLSRVTDIALDPAGYSGSLPGPWTLPYLRTLDISGNSLTGPLPGSLFSGLPRLTRLGLSGNSFTGKIPDSIGSMASLEELYLDSNRLTGPIPSTFTGLTKLNRLELQSNLLTRNLPNLTSLVNLFLLDASQNLLTGELPATLPPALVELSLLENQFTGNIPASLGSSSRFLQVLDVSHNALTGPVPSSLFDHPSLEQLTLAHNNFTSVQFPANSGLNSKLIAVDLSHNKIRGFLPSFIALMPKLSALSLEDNKLIGMIPSQYALRVAGLHGVGSAPLERLLLGGNYLFGPVPGVFTRLRLGSANVSLVGNCLYRCPEMFFFCRGGDQKSLSECRRFNLAIP